MNAILLEALLPRPKTLTVSGGTCSLARVPTVHVPAEDRRIDRAVQDWRRALATRVQATGRAGSNSDSTETPDQTIRVAIDQTAAPRPDEYRLRIHRDRIELKGASAAACFYGLQTLGQLTRRLGDRLPCCEIIDWPDFTTRGLLCDISRGRVPTLDALKTLVSRLAALKINQLQLYIEHTLTFSFDPQICGPDEGLTPDEVQDLDEWCQAHFIDLVPAVATFGHMGRILSMPRYRHLAEVEASTPWEQMSWPQRVRGLTLDCANPEAHALVERIWTDVLDIFPSPVVNICGDEPWDLGRGKNAGRFDKDGIGVAYVEQIRRTHAICAARGRRAQVWSDVVRNYPKLLPRLPEDLTVLHWGYDDRAAYEATGLFTSAGLETYVCPGTSGWKRIINAVDLAERNITTFATAGRRHTGAGLINTDWGDHGHFNLPACSLHGIAVGAATSWSTDHAVGSRACGSYPSFDDTVARLVLGVDDPEGIALLRRASAIAEQCETWRLMWTPLNELGSGATSLPSVETADETAAAARELERWCNRAQSLAPGGPNAILDLAEIKTAAQFTVLLADKVRIVHARRDGDRDAARLQHWGDELRAALEAYAECWLARAKPAGLEDIRRALSSVIPS